MQLLRVIILPALLFILPVSLVAQQGRPASPRGEASTQVGGSYDAEGRFGGGSWIVVDYGRPILRGRQNMFGSGDTYGDTFLRDAPLWRIGANQSTRFMTETDLMFGDKRLPAGEYSTFADLKPGEWTLAFSTWGVKTRLSRGKPGRPLGVLRVHPRTGRAPYHDEGDHPPDVSRPADHHLHGHDARGWELHHLVGRPICYDAVQSGSLGRLDPGHHGLACMDSSRRPRAVDFES